MKRLIAIFLAGVLLLTGCSSDERWADPVYYTDADITNLTAGSVTTEELSAVLAALGELSAGSITSTTAYVTNLYTWNGTGWDIVSANNTLALYVPYIGATNNLDLNAKEVTNGTLNAMVGKGTWTASGTWKLPAMYFNGDITTDRWLSNETNTFFGRLVIGAGGLAHTGGSEGYYNSGYGYQSLNALTIGIANTAIGNASLSGLKDGNYNTAVGSGSMVDLVSGSYNTAIGLFSGHGNLGNRNVFLGYRSGYNYLGDDALFVDNSDTDTPLISGNFSSNELTVNGELFATDNITLLTTSKIQWSDNSSVPVDTASPAAWLPVRLPDGTTAYMPVYK